MRSSVKPLLVLCLAGSLGLGAQGARAAEDDAEQRSAVLFREGVAAGKAGDYARAEVAFRASYGLVPKASTLRNWALSEMKLGKMVEALTHLKVALASGGWTPDQRAIVRQNLDDAYAATGHLSVKTGAGAQVTIDGVPVRGAAPFDSPLDVMAGERRVAAHLGADTAQADVAATAGTVVEVDLSIPGALQEAPVALRDAERPPPTSAVDPTLQRTGGWWTPPRAVAAGLAGAAAVGIGLGIYFDVAAHTAASDANALRAGLTGDCAAAPAPSGCGALHDKINAAHVDETLEGVAFAAGAAAALGAAVVFALARPSAPVRTGAVRWTPMITPQAAGVAGSF
jgi:hypothetical protein